MENTNEENLIFVRPPTAIATRAESKLWVTNYCTERQKPWKIIKSDAYRFFVNCTSPICSFELLYNYKMNVGYKLKSFKEHNCAYDIGIFKSIIVVEDVKQVCNDFHDVKANDIKNHMLSQKGLQLNYQQSYYSIGVANSEQITERLKSYGYIKPWLEWNKENNVNSHYLYGDTIGVDNSPVKFEYCFFALSQSKQAILQTLPIIVIDACHTKGIYKGMIFSACAITGENKLYRLAIGIAPTENYFYWKKFLTGLEEALNLSSIRNLVVISDREKGIATALEEVIPTASHSLCVFHIEKNIKSRFKTDTAGLIWKAAKAATAEEFTKYIDQIEAIKGRDVANYIRAIPSNLWATFSFPCPRYGHVTSNMAESLNSTFNNLRKLLPLEILTEFVRSHEENIIKQRSVFEERTDESLIPNIKTRLIRNKNIGSTLRLIQRADSNFVEVQKERNSSYYRTYDKIHRSCSCYMDKKLGFPCEHASRFIHRFGEQELEFVNPLLTNGSLKQLYLLPSDRPIDVLLLTRTNTSGAVQVRRRGRRRRNEARIPSAGESINSRSLKCSICNTAGHNRRTCTLQINN